MCKHSWEGGGYTFFGSIVGSDYHVLLCITQSYYSMYCYALLCITMQYYGGLLSITTYYYLVCITMYVLVCITMAPVIAYGDDFA